MPDPAPDASCRGSSAEQNGHASADAGDHEGRDEDDGDESGVHGYCFSRTNVQSLLQHTSAYGQEPRGASL
jgi:hypothetical protein